MRLTQKSCDITAAFKSDIAYHHEIGIASGNIIAMTLWSVVACHVMTKLKSAPSRKDQIGTDLAKKSKGHRQV